MSSVRRSRTSAIWAATKSRASANPPCASICWKCSQACSASCSVRSSTNQEPPAGSSTRPRWDSSSSSSCVLRAMRRAKLAAVPGNPPGIAASNGCTSTVSAPPTPAPNAATVVRSMFTHGSRCAIIGIDVTAWTRAAPCVGLADHLGHPGPQPAQHAEFGDRHELVVVCGQPEADLPQRVRHAEPGLAEQPQIGDARGDGSGQLPRRAGAEVVQRGPVDRDRAHATGVTR